MKIPKLFIFAVITCSLLLGSFNVFANEAEVYDFYYEDSYFDYVYGPMNVEIDWINNALHLVTINGPADGGNGDPYFMLRIDELDADVYEWCKVKIKNNSNADYFQFHFQPSTGLTGATNSLFPISKGDEDFKEYVVNMKAINLFASEHSQDTMYPFDLVESQWAGYISAVRLDCMFEAYPGGQIETDSEFDFEYIAFFASEEDANNFDIEAYRASITPVPTKEPTPEPTPSPEVSSPEKEETKAPSPSQSTDDKLPAKVDKKLYFIIGAVFILLVIIVVVLILIKKKKK